MSGATLPCGSASSSGGVGNDFGRPSLVSLDNFILELADLLTSLDAYFCNPTDPDRINALSAIFRRVRSVDFCSAEEFIQCGAKLNDFSTAALLFEELDKL